MDKILKNKDERAIATAIEDNFISFRLLFSRLPNARIFKEKGFLWIDSGTSRASWNGILKAKVPLEFFDDKVELVLNYFHEVNRPFSCWLGNNNFSSTIQEKLTSYGFVQDEESTGMAADLNDCQVKIPYVSGLKIKKLSTPHEWESHLAVCAKSFNLTNSAEQFLSTIYRSVKSCIPYPFQHYLGYIDDKPVASSLLFINSGITGIYFIGTIPTFRGKGIGSALTAYSMLRAKELGNRIAVLRASAMGEGIYRRLGFKDYFKFQLYLFKELNEVK